MSLLFCQPLCHYPVSGGLHCTQDAILATPCDSGLFQSLGCLALSWKREKKHRHTDRDSLLPALGRSQVPPLIWVSCWDQRFSLPSFPTHWDTYVCLCSLKYLCIIQPVPSQTLNIIGEQSFRASAWDFSKTFQWGNPKQRNSQLILKLLPSPKTQFLSKSCRTHRNSWKANGSVTLPLRVLEARGASPTSTPCFSSTPPPPVQRQFPTQGPVICQAHSPSPRGWRSNAAGVEGQAGPPKASREPCVSSASGWKERGFSRNKVRTSE